MLKKITLIIVTPLFTTLLLATAWTSGVNRTIGNPAPIKKTLSDSGIYSSVIGSFLDQAKSNVSSSGEVSLTSPVIKQAAESSFTPTVLQQNTEKFLDGTYKWLNKDVAAPDFSLDLSAPKLAFANSVADNLTTSLKALPACPSNISSADFDALTATCMPKTKNAAAEATKVKDTLLGGKGFLDNPVITSGDVKSGDSNQSIFSDQLNKVPDYFSWAKKAPMILGALTAVLGIAIVFLAKSRASGLRHISFTLIFVGLLMLAFAWGTSYVLNQQVIPKISFDNNEVLQDKVRIIAKDLTEQLDKNYWVFGGLYAGLGVVGLIAPMAKTRLGGRKTKAPKSGGSSSFGSQSFAKPVPKPEEPSTEAPSPEAEKTSTKKTIKVQ